MSNSKKNLKSSSPAYVESIIREGLKPASELGIVYLTPDPKAIEGFGEVLLEVETGDLKLAAFDDCKEWEVLCWGNNTC